MIIQENILINLNPRTINYYENKGYKIPRYKHPLNGFSVKEGTQIEISVKDLPPKSAIKVQCKCDICGKENLVTFNTIKKEYRCVQCSNTKFGQNNHNFNHKLSKKERILCKNRGILKGYNLWRKQVKERDNYTCQKCGSKEKIEAHHINNWFDFPEQRSQVDNGITLCKACHNSKNGKSIHNIFGKFTTKEHLKEFLK